MPYTTATLKTEVLNRIGRPDLTTLSTSLLLWLNNAQRDLANAHRFKCLERDNPIWIALTEQRRQYGTSQGFPGGFLELADESAVTCLEPDRLYVYSDTGIRVGDTLTGGTSLATGTVTAVATGYLDYTPLTGTFSEGETVTGVTTPPTTSKTAVVDDVVQKDGTELVLLPRTIDELRDTWTQTDEGVPEHYRLLSDTLTSVYPDAIELWPRPDAATYRVGVRYYGYLSDLSADGDVNWFTQHAAEALIWGACRQAFAHERDFDSNQLAEARFREAVQQVIALDNVQLLRSSLGGEFRHSGYRLSSSRRSGYRLNPNYPT